MFDEIKWFCDFTKYTTKIYNKPTIHVNKLIPTLFSPFDIKFKILNLIRKASGNVFLGHLAGYVFHIFLKLHSIICVCLCVCVCVCGRRSVILSRVFVDHGTIFSYRLYATSEMEQMAVTWSFVFNMRGLLDLTLKCIDQFSLRQ